MEPIDGNRPVVEDKDPSDDVVPPASPNSLTIDEGMNNLEETTLSKQNNPSDVAEAPFPNKLPKVPSQLDATCATTTTNGSDDEQEGSSKSADCGGTTVSEDSNQTADIRETSNQLTSDASSNLEGVELCFGLDNFANLLEQYAGGSDSSPRTTRRFKDQTQMNAVLEAAVHFASTHPPENVEHLFDGSPGNVYDESGQILINWRYVLDHTHNQYFSTLRDSGRFGKQMYQMAKNYQKWCTPGDDNPFPLMGEIMATLFVLLYKQRSMECIDENVQKFYQAYSRKYNCKNSIMTLTLNFDMLEIPRQNFPMGVSTTVGNLGINLFEMENQAPPDVTPATGVLQYIAKVTSEYISIKNALTEARKKHQKNLDQYNKSGLQLKNAQMKYSAKMEEFSHVEKIVAEVLQPSQPSIQDSSEANNLANYFSNLKETNPAEFNSILSALPTSGATIRQMLEIQLDVEDEGEQPGPSTIATSPETNVSEPSTPPPPKRAKRVVKKGRKKQPVATKEPKNQESFSQKLNRQRKAATKKPSYYDQDSDSSD